VPGSRIEYARIRGGNDGLTGAFADRLSDLRLGVPVTAVTEDEDRVEVTAGGGTMSARHVVLAAPLPALARVELSGVPDELVAALGGISYGRVTKNLLQTDERVWRDQGSTGYLATDRPLGSTWEATDQQPGRRGILIDYASADASDTAAARGVSAREDLVRTELDRVFPGIYAAAAGFATVAWPAEEYTGGSWIAPRPGELSDHWTTLRATHGRVHLAGEHTSVLSGYMESAVRSGRRVAAEVAARSD
jgi:monoamine oxidase